MRRKLILVFLTAMTLSACGVKTSSIGESIKINLTENRLGYNYGQMLIPAISESRIITETYSDKIWDSYVDRENNITYRDNYLNDLKNYYKELVVLKKIITDNNISLTEPEKSRALKLSNIFYNETVLNSEEFKGVTLENCDDVFLDYFLISKGKQELIAKNVKEVSEGEARIMDFHEIEVSDYELANTLLEKLNAGENCVKLATLYSESDNILRSMEVDTEPENVKSVLTTLEDGGISPIITDKGKYMLFKCVKSYDEEATRKNKAKIKEQRESDYLLSLYNNFVKENPIDINEGEFDKVCKHAFDNFSGRDFFTLISEDENAGL